MRIDRALDKKISCPSMEKAHVPKGSSEVEGIQLVRHLVDKTSIFLFTVWIWPWSPKLTSLATAEWESCSSTPARRQEPYQMGWKYDIKSLSQDVLACDPGWTPGNQEEPGIDQVSWPDFLILLTCCRLHLCFGQGFRVIFYLIQTR